VVREVHLESVEAIGNRRAGRAPGLVVGAEHEVIDTSCDRPAEQVLRASPVPGRCRSDRPSRRAPRAARGAARPARRCDG
jgi:hypothetical protein